MLGPKKEKLKELIEERENWHECLNCNTVKQVTVVEGCTIPTHCKKCGFIMPIITCPSRILKLIKEYDQGKQ